MKPSKCIHEWIDRTDDPPVCLHCGIPKVRSPTPRPVLKCPVRDNTPAWANRKYSSKDYSK